MTLEEFIEHSRNLVGANKRLIKIEASSSYQDEVKELKKRYIEAEVVLREWKRELIYLIWK